MGSRKNNEDERKTPVRSNGTQTSWGGVPVRGDETSPPVTQQSIPIVRINVDVLRQVDNGNRVKLVHELERVLVYANANLLGEVSAQHERLVRRHNVNAGQLAGVTQTPPHAGFYPSA
jgi:hypothetical protein